ncbi:MAG TPA: hypothetical protein VFN01_08120 [Marinobacter sp.]|uniref:hypothetical protein n=1 Tax=Marinobacter sp. TaxID=50741 RepID=UPI002D80C202|nr:hypothetical protein [Marinobacter sp.]HET8801135.1 hypothetical protein [Marinobacter sp.]
MKHLIKWTALAVALMFCGATQSAETPSSITLEHAWRAVLENDDLLAASRSAKARAESLASTANNLYLPQVDLVGSYTRIDSSIELDALALNPLNSAADTVPGQLLVDLVGGPGAFSTPVTSRNITRSSINTVWPIYTGGKITAKQNLLELEQTEASFLMERGQTAAVCRAGRYLFRVGDVRAGTDHPAASPERPCKTPAGCQGVGGTGSDIRCGTARRRGRL